MARVRQGVFYAVHAAFAVAAASVVLWGCPDAVPLVVGTGGDAGAPSSITSSGITSSGTTLSGLTSSSSSSSGALSCAKQVAFEPVAQYAVSLGATSVVTLGVNAGALPDLALVSPIGMCPCVSFLINDGKGNFTDGTNNYTVSSGVSLAAADMDGDGKTDLAVAAQGSDSVSVLLSLGGGSFSPKVDYPVGTMATAVVAVDLTGDGKPDLAVSDVVGTLEGTVSVLINNGDGTFAGMQNYTAGQSARALAAADFDGDKKTDLAVADYTGNQVVVLTNQGLGTFPANTPLLPAGPNPVAIVAVDLNADGRVDIVVANGNGVSVLMNLGSGNFASKVDFPSPLASPPLALAAADMNGDGNIDIIVGGQDTNIGILLGDGQGAFPSVKTYAVALSSPSSIVASDLNGDMKPDLAITDSSGTELSVLLNACP
jgi:hypothetical protein